MSQDPFGLHAQPPLSITLVQPQPGRLVVLELIEDNPEPDYCVHGRTKCFGCDRWCHLGPATVIVVRSGEAAPMCQGCAAPLVAEAAPYRRVRDQDGHGLSGRVGETPV